VTELLYNSSGKLLALKKLLKELFQAEHRVLIFSQMTK
jgi:SNF2 family DNA or RNA helicase